MENLADSILPIIRSTRAISLPGWGLAEVDHKKTGSPTDVVTKLDFEIEEYLAKEFAKVRPDIGFVGEEYGGDRTQERYWMVDPIDGTAHYIRGLPFCTTMVALIERGEVTFSGIYDFVNDIMYHAERGKGSYKDNQRIYVSDRTLENSYMFYESKLKVDNNAEKFLEVNKCTKIMTTINAGYEFTLVAQGKVEGRICVDPFGKDYDFAPGSLLVSEAGGVVVNIGSTKYDHTNLSFLAVNKVVYESLTTGPDCLFPLV